MTLTQLQKDRIHPVIRMEIAKTAENLIKQKTTLIRLKELLDIEIQEDKHPEEIERLKRTIKDYDTLISLQQEDLELLESIQLTIES